MQGFNMGRYIPPELEGLKSFNQASGKKPANRKADGSQIVRFECPFPIWCTTCQPEQIIAQGVRFNADKKKVGNYYSTPIWQFKIKHSVCGGWIVVRTDPKNTEYLVVEGGRRRDLGQERLAEGEIVLGRNEEEKAQVERDGAFGALEKKTKDKEETDRNKARVEELKKRSQRDWSDPYEMNRKIRKDFRVGRRQRQNDERTGEMLLDKYGLGLEMLAPDANDTERAKFIDFGAGEERKAVARGLFDSSATVARTLKQDHKQRAIRSELLTQHMTALQGNIKGNTMAKTDPFRERENAWEPSLRRKRDDEPPSSATMAKDDSDETSNTIRTMTTAPAGALVAYDSD